MKKRKVIISIFLVIVLSMSAFVAVQATSGDENNVFEQLKALITGNTNRIEKLENKVDSLENEIDKLKGEITELQKPKEEEKTTEKKKTTNNINKKPITTATTKKPNTTTTNNNTNKKPTTTDYQKQIDTLNKEIATLKKSIEELEKQDNKQTNKIETLKTELNSKSEELKNLVNSSSNNNELKQKDIIGTWDENGKATLTFNADGTATIIYDRTDKSFAAETIDSIYTATELDIRVRHTSNYKYTITDNYINLTLVSATKQNLAGTKTITTKNPITGEEHTETIATEAEQPVDDNSANKKITYIAKMIDNSLIISSANAQLTKVK